jgi:hypothetical protein
METGKGFVVPGTFHEYEILVDGPGDYFSRSCSSNIIEATASKSSQSKEL